MATKSPVALMKEKFGEKKSLVEALEKLTKDDLWVARTNKDKGLAHVSNAKLLRLHAIFTTVKEKFGTRDKLITAILELTKRTKDDGYRASLSKHPVPRLFDLYKSTAKRTAAASAKKEAAAKAAPAKAAKAAPVEAKPKAKAAAKSAKPKA
jgi:hypothetical protein